jgi:hypothetical protein
VVGGAHHLAGMTSVLVPFRFPDLGLDGLWRGVFMSAVAGSPALISVCEPQP